VRESLESLLLAASRSAVIDLGQLEGTYRLVLRAACEGLAIARAGIWLLLPDRTGIRCVLLVDRAHEVSSESLVLTREQFPRYFAALDTERTVVAHDACVAPETAEFADGYLRPLGIASMLDVPIRHRGEMVGIICCEHVGPQRRWTAEEATFAAALADLVGRAITASRHAEAERALRALNATLEERVAERTRALENALTAAEVASNAKTQFLANMSHELRTPLNAVIGYCELLLEDIPRDTPVGAVLVELGAIRSAGGHLLAMINDILDVARIESGRAQIDVRSWPVEWLIREIVATIRPEVERQGNRLVVELSPETGDVLADLRSARQILINLLGNAAKFTEAGTVTLAIGPEGAGSVVFQVRDTGIGIPAEHLGRLFEPFFQVDMSPTRRRGGTGLGLAISRTLAEAMGGGLSVVSEVGVGSTFTLRLPRG
jgi:two-component system NtrC family sensor kinase